MAHDHHPLLRPAAMTASDMRVQLDRLVQERREAANGDLRDNSLYMDDLEADLAAAHSAYVGLAVTEIASLRSELSGPQQG